MPPYRVNFGAKINTLWSEIARKRLKTRLLYVVNFECADLVLSVYENINE